MDPDLFAHDRRSTNSLKWDGYRTAHGHGGSTHPDPMALWVADMDIAPDPALLAIVTQRVVKEGLGYVDGAEGVARAVARYYARRGYQVSPRAVLFLGGVLVHMRLFMLANYQPGDEVLVLTPVYPGYLYSSRRLNFKLVEAPLKAHNKKLSIDWTAV
jgi:cystathionine beta-lyase